jgi:hypothetical protein
MRCFDETYYSAGQQQYHYSLDKSLMGLSVTKITQDGQVHRVINKHPFPNLVVVA